MDDCSIRMTHRYADGHANQSEALHDVPAEEARPAKDGH